MMTAVSFHINELTYDHRLKVFAFDFPTTPQRLIRPAAVRGFHLDTNMTGSLWIDPGERDLVTPSQSIIDMLRRSYLHDRESLVTWGVTVGQIDYVIYAVVKDL